jgi:hypothetical protein
VDHAFLEGYLTRALRYGQTLEAALIDAVYALRAAHGRDYRTKLLLSPLVSRAQKAVIQVELLREGQEVQAWLEAVAAQEALAVALGYDQALRDLTVSDTLALLRALHRRHQHN